MESLSSIPLIIKNSVFLDEEKNEKQNSHLYINKYQYFLSGLKIKDDYFTVKSVIAIDQNNNRYYDHYIYNHPKELYLTTKKTEVDFQTRYQLTEPVWNENQTSALYYDKRLYEIYQCSQAKFLDKNFEPNKAIVAQENIHPNIKTYSYFIFPDYKSKEKYSP